MNNEELLLKAIEIVNKLAPRWPWEDPHQSSIEYVLQMLKEVCHEHS